MIIFDGIGSIQSILFSAGRKSAAIHRLNITDSPSSAIENKAKFTENRLSMVSTLKARLNLKT
jgi:hypothetical protein